MSVGVDGDVRAYSSDWASDSRDSRERASQHAMTPTWKSRRASGAWSCATGARAQRRRRLSRRSSTEKRRIHSAQSSCVSRTRDSTSAAATPASPPASSAAPPAPAAAGGGARSRRGCTAAAAAHRRRGRGAPRRSSAQRLGATPSPIERAACGWSARQLGPARQASTQSSGGGRAVGVAARGAEELRREGGDGVVEGEVRRQPVDRDEQRALGARAALDGVEQPYELGQQEGG